MKNEVSDSAGVRVAAVEPDEAMTAAAPGRLLHPAGASGSGSWLAWPGP